MSHARVAEVCGVSKNTVLAWERGAKIPAEALARLIPHGLDPLFVLAGARAGEPIKIDLLKDELELLEAYRALDEDRKRIARLQLTALAEGSVRGGRSPTVRVRGEPKGDQ